MISKKHFRKREQYTDGFYITDLVCLHTESYYGCMLEVRFKGAMKALIGFPVREYGSYEKAEEEALKCLTNNHYKKVEVTS